jgi:RNA polymerase sigma-70 factor (ECF subfamily)
MRGEIGTRPTVEIASAEELNAAIVATYPDLMRRAMYLTRDREAATELVHRTVERACASRRHLKGGSNAAHWLGAIMTNQFIDELRRRRACPFMRGIAPDNVATPAVDASPIWSGLCLDDVLVAVRHVPDRFRVPFELHALRGFSHRAISLRLGVPMKTVGTRIYRAKQALRRLLMERALQRGADVAIPLPVGARRPIADQPSIPASAPRVLLEEGPDQFGGVEVARGGAAG